MDDVRNSPAVGTRATEICLEASRDKASGLCVFPRIPVASPAAPRYVPVMLSNRAVLYSFTVIHPNPKTGVAPFPVVYADFAEGARAFGRLRLRKGERPQIGMALAVEADPDSPGADPQSAYIFTAGLEEQQ
jgi:uncharacterized OB-fold protein